MGALKYYNPDTSQWEYAENPNYVSSSFSEELTGTINGTNTVFTTTAPFAAIDVYKNGVHMRPGASNDYTITGSNQITFNTAPASGSTLSASYSTPNSGLIVGSNSIVTKETPTGSVNGSNTAFTTAMSYVAGSLQVYVNGLAQSSYVTETSPTAGTFSLDTAPLTGDDIKVSYQHTGSVSGNADTVDGYHFQGIMDSVYPVGSEYTNFTNSTNPATLLNMPWSTWVAVEGRVVIGKAASGTFATAGATGGSETHQHALTIGFPTYYSNALMEGTQAGPYIYDGANTTFSATISGKNPKTRVRNTADAASGTSFAHDGFSVENTGNTYSASSLPPYVVGYVWRRTV